MFEKTGKNYYQLVWSWSTMFYLQVKKLQLLTFLLFQVNAAAEIIYDLVDPNANLIFGAVIDPSLSGQVSL